MGCPYYQDYTRMCIGYFEEIVQYPSFNTCETEKYQDCLAYVIMQKDFKCKYLKRCVEDSVKNIPLLVKYFIEDETTIKIFRDIAEKYCTVESRHTHCANYVLFEQGKQPPLDLLPDGRHIRMRDILLRREITIE